MPHVPLLVVASPLAWRTAGRRPRGRLARPPRERAWRIGSRGGSGGGRYGRRLLTRSAIYPERQPGASSTKDSKSFAAAMRRSAGWRFPLGSLDEVSANLVASGLQVDLSPVGRLRRFVELEPPLNPLVFVLRNLCPGCLL